MPTIQGSVSIKYEEDFIMNEIREMLNKVADECEVQGIPLLAAFGLDIISVVEFAPDCTPERIKKARVTLVNTTMQARRQLEIQA